MPDWSYHPVFRPLLFRLAPRVARDLTLGALGRLTRLPGGRRILAAFGHMQPPPGLQRTLYGVCFPSPVGLGAGLDLNGTALTAFSAFGFGFLELGPVTLAPIAEGDSVTRHPAAIGYDLPLANPGLAALLQQIHAGCPLPLGVRLGFRPGADAAEASAERCQLMGALEAAASFFVLDCRLGLADGAWSLAEWTRHVNQVVAASARPVLLCLPPDIEPHQREAALGIECAGFVVGGGVRTAGGRLVGAPTAALSLELVRLLRERLGPQATIIGSGGIDAPATALAFLGAGATLIQLHSGLVYAGPNLVKRINETILSQQPAQPALPQGWFARLTAPWVWGALFGASMIIGGGLAALIAMTRVILPYDEAFVGVSRAALLDINERLLPFMAHDRVTLAGTMISIGVLYWQLAVHGLRKHSHWARQTLLISSGVGFASFFLFLGFGYFDPLHALVSALLFPLFLLAIRGRDWAGSSVICADLQNDRHWRRGVWGQFVFVLLGIGLIGAGVAITGVGVTSVFVAEDLAFMRTTAETLRAANPRLIPLIAHDRAGFGGALVSNGLAVLLLALWGFRRGARWVWWTMVLAGVPGFIAAIGVHLTVGYVDLFHVAPALAAVVLFVLALGLSYGYLMRRSP